MKLVQNVAILPVVTTLDLQAERVLQAALGEDLKGCVVLGQAADGGLYFASSFADGRDVLWWMEKAKRVLMDISE